MNLPLRPWMIGTAVVATLAAIMTAVFPAFRGESGLASPIAAFVTCAAADLAFVLLLEVARRRNPADFLRGWGLAQAAKYAVLGFGLATVLGARLGEHDAFMNSLVLDVVLFLHADIWRLARGDGRTASPARRAIAG